MRVRRLRETASVMADHRWPAFGMNDAQRTGTNVVFLASWPPCVPHSHGATSGFRAAITLSQNEAAGILSPRRFFSSHFSERLSAASLRPHPDGCAAAHDVTRRRYWHRTSGRSSSRPARRSTPDRSDRGRSGHRRSSAGNTSYWHRRSNRHRLSYCRHTWLRRRRAGSAAGNSGRSGTRRGLLYPGTPSHRSRCRIHPVRTPGWPHSRSDPSPRRRSHSRSVPQCRRRRHSRRSAVDTWCRNNAR